MWKNEKEELLQKIKENLASLALYMLMWAALFALVWAVIF